MNFVSEKFYRFVEQHSADDPENLALKLGSGVDPEIRLALTHLACLKKSRRKFLLPDGSEFRPEILGIPLSVEQATSAPIALFHASLIAPGSRVVDLTTGLGMDVLAISQTPENNVLGFELKPEVAELARYNFRNRPNVEIRNQNSIEFIEQTTESFDYAFIDPARRDSAGRRVYNIHDCQPDLAEIKKLIFEKSPRIVAKLSPMLDPTQLLRDLPETSRLYVVDNGGECKEVLALMEKDFSGESTIIVRNNETEFSFTQKDERNSQAEFALPEPGAFLLEPSPAAMKGAPYKYLCRYFGITKIAPSTHLYLAATVPTGFPGKAYRIVAVEEYSSRNLKHFSRSYPKLDITAHNFQSKVTEIVAKLKTKPSSVTRGFACTLSNGLRSIIIAEKI